MEGKVKKIELTGTPIPAEEEAEIRKQDNAALIAAIDAFLALDLTLRPPQPKS